MSVYKSHPVSSCMHLMLTLDFGRLEVAMLAVKLALASYVTLSPMVIERRSNDVYPKTNI